MTAVLSSPQQVTPAWLTDLFQRQGVLARGQVEDVTAGEAQPTFASNVWRLAVGYSKDAPPGLPRTLFLKCSNPSLAPGEYDPQGFQREILFYQTVAPAMNAPFIIPCYSAVYQVESGAAHLLLMDVSETHGPSPKPPGLQHVQQALSILARLHAFWWDHPRLGEGIGQFPTQADRQQEWADAEKAGTAFMAHLGEQLPQAWRDHYQQVLPALPRLYERHASRRNMTLVHGDAHLGNFLFPHPAATHPAYILDWQFWHLTIGGTDLAFLLATESTLEFRRAFEGTLLRHYYRTLLGHGVQNYSWEECWDDYRRSVILVSMFIPVWRWSIFHWEVDHCALERGMTAFTDLQCAELL